MSSKYQAKKELKTKGKPRGKKSFKPKEPVVLGAPTFQYTSKCCEAPATKTACLKDRDVKFEDRKATLGKWRCTKCKRKGPVSRKLNKENLNVNDLLATGSRPNQTV